MCIFLLIILKIFHSCINLYPKGRFADMSAKKDFQISFVFTWMRVRKYIIKNVFFVFKRGKGCFIKRIILLSMSGLITANLA
jgi:hypothetical protein